MAEDRITYFAETDARNKRVPFGIKADDRSRHMYVIGKTGMGKSTMLENLAIQDMKNGEGMAFIDPHGKTAELLLDYIPQERIKDVLYFAPFDLDYPVSFNVMEDVGHDKRHLVANGLMSAFKKIWVDAWSARMEYILNNILLALLEYPDATLIGVNRMLADKDYRNKVVANITDPSVKSFWTDEFAKYGEKYMQEAGAAIQNKIGQFISNPVIRNIIGQPKSTFDLRQIMDEKKIVIINLSKGRVGEANANLLGSMLITKIYLGAMSRADASPGLMKRLPPFYLYVDEFQNFANESFADILSEARKYKLALTVAHQYIEQMSDEVRSAVFGNVGSMIVFRVGAFDAEVLEKEFAPIFTQEDIVNLGFVQVYMKLMIDGVTSQPFSATTLPPIEKPLVSFKDDIIKASRAAFARPRASVEEEIRDWHQAIQKVEDPRKRDALPRGDFKDSKPGGDNRGPRTPMGLARPVAPSLASVVAPYKNRQAESDAGTPSAPKESDPRQSQQPVSSFKDKDKSPEQMKESMKNALRDAQERELRNAITQNNVKNSADQEKRSQQLKRDKGPQPENISALRDALAAVLKEANLGVVSQPQTQQQQLPVQVKSADPVAETKSFVQAQAPQPKTEIPVQKAYVPSPMLAHVENTEPEVSSHSYIAEKALEPEKTTQEESELEKPAQKQLGIELPLQPAHELKSTIRSEQAERQRFGEYREHPRSRPGTKKESTPQDTKPAPEPAPATQMPKISVESREVPEDLLRRILELDK